MMQLRNDLTFSSPCSHFGLSLHRSHGLQAFMLARQLTVASPHAQEAAMALLDNAAFTLLSKRWLQSVVNVPFHAPTRLAPFEMIRQVCKACMV
jgi:hypothetical protein